METLCEVLHDANKGKYILRQTKFHLYNFQHHRYYPVSEMYMLSYIMYKTIDQIKLK